MLLKSIVLSAVSSFLCGRITAALKRYNIANELFLRYCMKQHSTTNCNRQYQLPPVEVLLKALIYRFIRYSLVVVRPIIRSASGEQYTISNLDHRYQQINTVDIQYHWTILWCAIIHIIIY